uniref:Uncharacterized protein n=1 Tax=Clastoptera arizonana TaxID=38151 RepID=A0A1B6DHC8_9HEMI
MVLSCLSMLFVFYSVPLLNLYIGAEEYTEDTGGHAPVNLTIENVLSTSVELSWSKPEQNPQDIIDYHIYYLLQNSTNVNVQKVGTNSLLKYTLTNLEPFSNYKIWVKALSAKLSESAPSNSVFNMTDVSGPGPPNILNISCTTGRSLYLQWDHPLVFNKSIDFYIISYRIENSFDDFKEILINVSNDAIEQLYIHNLSDNVVYEIKVTAGTFSIYHSKEVIGSPSGLNRVSMTCDKKWSRQLNDSYVGTEVILSILCASFVFILCIVAFIIWRNCFHAAYYYLEDSPPNPPAITSDWDMAADHETTVPLLEFPKHVASLHADGDIGFSKEYEAIQAAATQHQFATEYSQYPENKLKNRYLNILAYDHSRVKLSPITGQNRWMDYINANYIDGFIHTNAYIGTQGPLPVTFDCFWRMIWEQGVAIIVMITNLVERGRRKCDMYWPKEGVEVYGYIQVKLIKEDILAMYTVRTLQISHLRMKKKKHNISERVVYQFHYTNWPDHGTPDHPLPILSFVKKSSSLNPPDAGPIVVHCSAGVGRTGTYIVLDAMLKQICLKNEVNIYGFLKHIRTQRNFLVQTEEQYIFIHDALLEAIICSENSLSSDCLSYLLKSVVDPFPDRTHEHWLKLEAHFKMVTLFQPKDYNLVSANKECNRSKNRSQNFIPVESSRVHLTPKAGIDGSDYINASWYLGFKKLKEFIITQHPLATTILDFWQMVWDHNAQTIVLLSTVNEEEDNEYNVFWPAEGKDTLDGENFKVKCIVESELDGTVSRDLTVQSLQDDYELTVRIIQSPCPEPLSDIPALLSLLKVVQQWHLEYQNGPIVVVDKFGSTEAATFCCLATLSKQFEYESHADVCMYAKLYHSRRPGVWKTMDDYLLLYQALEVLSASKGVQHMNLQSNGYSNGDLGTPLPSA